MAAPGGARLGSVAPWARRWEAAGERRRGQQPARGCAGRRGRPADTWTPDVSCHRGVGFCHPCISAGLKNNATCPYCRVAPSEVIPPTKMESTYRNYTECETQVCLSEMRSHLRTWEKYIEKYGPLQELTGAGTRLLVQKAYHLLRASCSPDAQKNLNIYPYTSENCTNLKTVFPLCNKTILYIENYILLCYCQGEEDEDELVDHCHHRLERRACPICCLTPRKDPSCFSRNFIRHLQLRHALHYEDYIDINTVGEVLVERVLDGSFLEYVHASHSNSM
ncbi:LOW QUALITY PROTEIN: E3 ubiquitin-protein ligase RNF125-like [Pterocles gutturalis]